MYMLEKLLKVRKYTNIAWKGCFNERELSEYVIEDYNEFLSLYDAGEPTKSYLCILYNLLKEDIYQENPQVEVLTAEEFEKCVDEYISLVIDGRLDYTKLD